MSDQSKVDSIDRRTLLRGVGVAGLAGLAGCTGGDGDGEVIEWHAGGESGTYFPLSNEIKGIVEENTDFSLQVQSTGASVENASSLGNESAHFALLQNDVAYFARNGTGLEDFEESIENIRGVATLYPETIHIVVQPEANVETLEDLEGQRVNTGDLGSGTQVNALQILESVAGLTPDDFDEQNSGFGVAADQIRDGDVDAAFVVGGWPVGAVEDLATNTEIDILALDADAREQVMADAEWFAEDTIPGGTYEGVDEDVETVSVQAMIGTHEGVDADTVETITSTLFDSVDELTTKTDYIDRESAQDGMPIELHEGAERVFE